MATGAGATGAAAMTGVTGAGATGTTAMIVMAAAAADTAGARVTAETAEATAMIATTVRCAMFPATAGDPAPAAPAPFHRYRTIHVRARIEGEADWRAGVANFGRTPTTGLRDPLLETHIFDFNGNIYGKRLEVQLVAYLRPEKRFDSLDLMVAQMHIDSAEARAILATPG